MNQTMMTEGAADRVAALAAGSVALGLETLEVRVRGTDAGTTEEVYPGALVTLSGGGYAKAHQLKGAKVALKLSGYWPVASGTWYGELDVRFRGRRPKTAPAVEGVTGLRLLCTGWMSNLDDKYRQLIALPQEVTGVKPTAVSGDWEIEDDALVLNLEADWVLPLTARPEDEDELRYVLSLPAYTALYVRGDVEWLDFETDYGGDASISIEGGEK